MSVESTTSSTILPTDPATTDPTTDDFLIGRYTQNQILMLVGVILVLWLSISCFYCILAIFQDDKQEDEAAVLEEVGKQSILFDMTSKVEPMSSSSLPSQTVSKLKESENTDTSKTTVTYVRPTRLQTTDMFSRICGRHYLSPSHVVTRGGHQVYIPTMTMKTEEEDTDTDRTRPKVKPKPKKEKTKEKPKEPSKSPSSSEELSEVVVVKRSPGKVMSPKRLDVSDEVPKKKEEKHKKEMVKDSVSFEEEEDKPWLFSVVEKCSESSEKESKKQGDGISKKEKPKKVASPKKKKKKAHK